jgi:hypothetical protein
MPCCTPTQHNFLKKNLSSIEQNLLGYYRHPNVKTMEKPLFPNLFQKISDNKFYDAVYFSNIGLGTKSACMSTHGHTHYTRTHNTHTSWTASQDRRR